jgi:hypothetical protein
MASTREAAIASGITERTLYEWVAGKKIHSLELGDGSLLICLKSILEQRNGGSL